MSETKYGHSAFGSEEQFCTAENILSMSEGSRAMSYELHELAWKTICGARPVWRDGIVASVERPVEAVGIDHLGARSVALELSATTMGPRCTQPPTTMLPLVAKALALSDLVSHFTLTIDESSNSLYWPEGPSHCWST